MENTKQYNFEVAYNINISPITKGDFGWIYKFTETTTFATHIYAYYSENLKALTKHRNALIKIYEKQKEKLDKNSFWKGEVVKHSIFKQNTPKTL